MNIAEKIGFGLLIIGFVFMVLNGRIENTSISGILEKYQLFYWGGLAIWALGNISNTAKKKKQK